MKPNNDSSAPEAALELERLEAREAMILQTLNAVYQEAVADESDFIAKTIRDLYRRLNDADAA